MIAAGRSDTFVPIDTENIGEPQLAVIQVLADEATAKHGPLDAIVSTDADSDQPLILGVDPATAEAHSESWWLWWWPSICRPMLSWFPSVATTP